MTTAAEASVAAPQCRFFVVHISLTSDSATVRVPVFCPCAKPECGAGERMARFARAVGMFAPLVQDVGMIPLPQTALDARLNSAEVPFAMFMNATVKTYGKQLLEAAALGRAIIENAIARQAAVPPAKPH
jgi:hypothetical protein